MNKVILIGRLGRDPELRYTDKGTAVANLSLATDYRAKGRDPETTWHRIVAWDKTADICAKYLAKGRQVGVEGRIQVREWKDKQGNDRKTTEIVAERIEFIGSKSDAADDNPGARADRGFDYGPPPTGDDVPW